MVALPLVFYIFVILFAIVGSMRGWAKEVLVIFSVILALAFIYVLENMVPVVMDFIRSSALIQFWVRTAILVMMVFFGYQSPRLPRFAQATARKDQIQDVLLGLFMGAISGYLIAGSIWAFMETAGYPFSPVISQPTLDTPMGEAALRIIDLLPTWLAQPPTIFIAVVLAFIFVLVVLI
jgi:hypothetical protein